MFVLLSKFLALPFYPVGSALSFIAAGCLALFFHRQKLGRAALVCACLELVLFSTDPLSWLLVRSLERQYDPATSFPAASAIVLLTGGEVARHPPRLWDEVNAAGDRILYAERLLRQGAAPRLIITGGTIPFLRTIEGSEAEASYRIIASLCSADTARILLEKKARNTWENGLFTKRMLDSLRLQPSVILVTSALHMPRSVAVFRKLGVAVYPAPTDYAADVPFQWRAIGMIPNAGSLNQSTNALHEWYGIVAYKLFGKL